MGSTRLATTRANGGCSKAYCCGSSRVNPIDWPSIKLTSLIDHVIVIRNNIEGGFDMQTVTVSPKYQVVIPKAVREALHLRPGQKMQVVEYDGRIELIPERDIKELRGFLKGINTEFEREEDRV